MLADSGLHRGDFLLVIDEAGVMLRLRHLCEVASLPEAHSDLLVRDFHVLTHLLRLDHGSAINAAQYFLKTTVDGVGAIQVLILHRKRFFQLGDARRLPEFLLVTDRAQLRYTSLV